MQYVLFSPENIQTAFELVPFLSLTTSFTNHQAVGRIPALLPTRRVQPSFPLLLQAILSLSACMNNSAGVSLRVVAMSEQMDSEPTETWLQARGTGYAVK
jgi:hypothetical protein